MNGWAVADATRTTGNKQKLHLQRQDVGHQGLQRRERHAHHLVQWSSVLLRLVLVPFAHLPQRRQRVKDAQRVRGLNLVVERRMDDP